MVRLVMILSLFFSVSVFAVAPSGVPTKNAGSVNANSSCLALAESDTNYFALSALRSAGNTNGVAGFFKSGSQYQVPAGKYFKAYCAVYSADTAGAGWQFVSSSVAVLGGVGAGANNVYENGATSLYGRLVLTANTWAQVNTPYSWQSSFFPAIQADTAPKTSVIIVGREFDNPEP